MTKNAESYINTILGPTTTHATLTTEYGLDLSNRRSLDEWLGEAEEAARQQLSDGDVFEFDVEAGHIEVLDWLCEDVD